MNDGDKQPLYRLKDIAEILRGKDGCPWDREQTFSSLKPYLIEEAYEVYDAIDSGNIDNLKEELGDLLYQVYAHSEIASEKSLFSIDDVAEGITSKLIRRHPHVFGSEEIADSKGVKDRWEEIKKDEKKGGRSVLAGIPRTLPALLMAYRIQEKVSHIGFDWERMDDAVRKLDEEISEFKEVIQDGDIARINDEAGDILFSIVNVMRFLKVNPEDALRGTIDKFINRFRYIETAAAKTGTSINSMTLEELDTLWEEAKKASS